MKPNEGIYFFGGRDGNNKANNNLWLLKIYQHPAEFVPVETKGKTPVGRYGHSFSHIENSSYLVLYGGRNDEFFKIFTYKTCLSFLDVLDVDKMQWMKVILGSYKPSARLHFSSAMAGSRLFVFGGLTDDNYIPAQMERLEFDSAKVEQMIQLEAKAKLNSGRTKIILDPDAVPLKEQKDSKSEDKKPSDAEPMSPIHRSFISIQKPHRKEKDDHSEQTRSISNISGISPNTKSYLPVPKTIEARERHVHGFSFSIKAKPT